MDDEITAEPQNVIKSNNIDHIQIDDLNVITTSSLINKSDTNKIDKIDTNDINKNSIIVINRWSPKVELYITNIADKCVRYRNLHESSFIFYNTRYEAFTLFIIVISFLGSVLSFVANVMGNNIYFGVIIFILLSFITTMTTINKFFKYQELATKHRSASQKFLELNSSIKEEFLLSTEERKDAITYVRNARKLFEEIVKSVPYPPLRVIKNMKNPKSPDNIPENIPENLPELTEIKIQTPTQQIQPESSQTQETQEIPLHQTEQIPQTQEIQEEDRLVQYTLQQNRLNSTKFLGDYDEQI